MLFDQLYDKPWTRLGPYLVGMFTGWFIFKTKAKLNVSKVITIWLSPLSFADYEYLMMINLFATDHSTSLLDFGNIHTLVSGVWVTRISIRSDWVCYLRISRTYRMGGSFSLDGNSVLFWSRRYVWKKKKNFKYLYIMSVVIPIWSHASINIRRFHWLISVI